MISINKVNTKKLERALKEYRDDAIIEVKGVNLDTASTISANAKKNVSVDRGTLRNSIRVDETDKINYRVGTNLPYAPYIEFGTGRKVVVPPEFKDLALKARKNKGQMTNGMDAKPFFYPAFVQGRRSYNKEMKKAFERLSKKFKR